MEEILIFIAALIEKEQLISLSDNNSEDSLPEDIIELIVNNCQ